MQRANLVVVAVLTFGAAACSLFGVRTATAQSTTEGFTWKVPDRFGMLKSNGVVEYHWNLVTEDYDASWIDPERFPVVFDACDETETESGRSSARRFEWTFGGPNTNGELSGNACRVSHQFGDNNTTYTAALKITENGVTDTFGPYDIAVRDLLIVQIGDSYASGEGAPDLPRGDNDYATWIDRRCHRSAKTGAAQAAIAIERIDQYSSVTFLSYACSGATIDTESRDDDGRIEGKGLLGRYRGMEVGMAQRPFVPAQVEMLPKRTIDALIIGAGGNDIRFSKIIAACVSFPGYPCREEPELTALVDLDLGALPAKYGRLSDELNKHAIRHVFLTEYPDPTKDDSGATCSMMIDDILFPAVWMGEDDANWASAQVLPRLNIIMRDAVSAASGSAGETGPQWHFVDGISEAFQGSRDGRGHGYCADDNWIMTATESAEIQGPDIDAADKLQVLATIATYGLVGPAGGLAAGALAASGYVALQLKKNTGTMHPNEIGHRVVRDRLVEALARELFAANVQCKEATGIAFTSGGIKCMPTSDPTATDCSKFENDFERQACGATNRPMAKNSGGADDDVPDQCGVLPAEPDLGWTQLEITGNANAVGTVTLAWQRCLSETTTNQGLEDLPIFSWQRRVRQTESYNAVVTLNRTDATARLSAKGKLNEKLTEHVHTECNNRMTTMTNILESRSAYAGAATRNAIAAIRTIDAGYLILITTDVTPVDVRMRISSESTGACQPPGLDDTEITPEVKGGIEIGVTATRQGTVPELIGSWTGPAVNSIGQVGMLTVSWNLRLTR